MVTSLKNLATGAFLVGILLSGSAFATPPGAGTGLDVLMSGASNVKINRAVEASGPGCGKHEIAVGTYKTCSPAPSINPVIPPDGGCGATYGALWAGNGFNNCDQDHWTLSGMTEGFCDGGFKEGITVKCDDKGAPTAVFKNGWLVPWWSECRPHSVSCTRTNGIASAYAEIQYCCGVWPDYP